MLFLTGYPGFLGSALLPRLLAQRPEISAICLVQDKFRTLAEQRLEEQMRAHVGLQGRVRLISGDLTEANLGLDDTFDAKPITEIFHFAAVYDLAVTRELGMKVNVEGTRRVLDFAAECPKLQRLHYVSTCYVSGRHCGIFRETDLDKGQRFNNFYEETKFLAEVDVRHALEGGLPATVYRPAIVVGDSRTGQTQKFDGLYFVTELLLRQPRFLSVLPLVGDPDMARINLVPCDYIIDAILALSHLPESLGRTYQLADPEPLTIREAIDLCYQTTERTRTLELPLPKGLAKWNLKSVPPVQKMMGLPAEAIDYFVHPTHYTSEQSQHDLHKFSITVPPLPSYFAKLLEFQLANRGRGLGSLV